MTGLITDPDAFRQLFVEFSHTAWRLESRENYGVPEEDEPFQQFLKGADPGVKWLRPWLDLMNSQTSIGKRVERVRVIDNPPTDYQRFETFVSLHNINAGEDIRYLSRTKAADRLALPKHDFWLFDSCFVVFLHYDVFDRFLGFTTTDDPFEVVRHCQWRDAAWTWASVVPSGIV